MKVSFPAILSKVETKADRSIKLIYETRELGAEATELFRMVHSEGYLLFSPNDDLTEADIPAEKADPMLGTKTQAQRLRNVIYKVWQQNGSEGNFEDHYRIVLERIIDWFKEQLD